MEPLNINAHNLHENLSGHRLHDETERLIKTLNSMIEHLEETLFMAQQFSVDVSRELRTSLTVFRDELKTVLRKKNSIEELSAIITRCVEEISYVIGMIRSLLFLTPAQPS